MALARRTRARRPRPPPAQARVPGRDMQMPFNFHGRGCQLPESQLLEAAGGVKRSATAAAALSVRRCAIRSGFLAIAVLLQCMCRHCCAGQLLGEPLAPWQCTDALSCSLNGRCDATSGRCACRGGWGGTRCSQLRFAPATSGAGYQRRVRGINVSSWGGSVLKGEDGRWHMWVAEMVNHCGLGLGPCTACGNPEYSQARVYSSHEWTACTCMHCAQSSSQCRSCIHSIQSRVIVQAQTAGRRSPMRAAPAAGALQHRSTLTVLNGAHFQSLSAGRKQRQADAAVEGPAH